jgi:UDP-N-acetylglucosamine diphosphorylase/glucosamine-1-phosphate N-acetyltransferase
MHYILSDYNRSIDFFPLTLSRPVAELRFGVLTIAEQWKRLIGQGIFHYDTSPHLHEKYEHYLPQKEHVVINAAVYPTSELAKAIRELKAEQILKANGLEIARKVGDQTQEWSNVNFEEHSVYFLHQLADLFALLGKVLPHSIEELIGQRKSFPLHPSNTVIGKHKVFLEKGAEVYGAILNTQNGPIYIGENALVMEGALIRGPFALGDSAVVKMGSKIYGPSVVGPFCKVGGELNNVNMHSYSNKGHDGYLGNAVIGQWCNLGANTTNSNLKNTMEEVRMYSYRTRRFEPTGLQFCGLVMGDHSKTAVGTLFNTGTVVGFSSNVFSNGFPRNFIPSFKWGGAQGLSTYPIEKAKRTAVEMMKRRDVQLDTIEEALFDYLFKHKDSWE